MSARIVFLAALILVSASPLLPQALAIHRGHHQVLFSEPILWPTSGAYLPDQEKLFLVDSARERILRVGYHGLVEECPPWDRVKTASAPGSRDPTLRRPVQIRASGEAYLILHLVDDGNERLVPQILRVDEDLKPLGPPLPLERAIAPYRLGAIHDFSPLGTGIVVLAELEGSEGKKSGFLYADLARSSSVTFLHELSEPNGIGAYTALSFARFIATPDEETAFILVLGDVPHLMRFDRGTDRPRDLGSLPASLGGFPAYPRQFPRPQPAARQGAPLDFRYATEFLRVLENEPRTVMGLHSWNGGLYLLGRESRGEANGEITWSLVRVDPETGKMQGRTSLPTRAAHVLIVPGQESLAVVERGHVEALSGTYAPYMKTYSLLHIDPRGP